MAATLSQAAADSQIPTATLALPSISSRRLPPPCWTPEETVALIDAYRDKWYSLRRGNLRANHWQEVADDVASRCPAYPPKTAVQCRHKMEKLRKRYRAEIQRAATHGGLRRYSSAWAHFQNMHAMETGINSTPPSSSSSEPDDHITTTAAAINRINNIYNRNTQRSTFVHQLPVDTAAAAGFRVKVPKFEEIGQNPNPRFPNSIPIGYGAASANVLREGFLGRGEMGKRVINNSSKKKAYSAMDDAVASIQALGEGFMRIEKVKMEMIQQIEEMRMEMELKRTEMILDSQQRIVEAFANAVSERNAKRAKRMTSHCWNQV